MHWIYLIHEFHILSWITEINELFHDILVYWDAPVYPFKSTNLHITVCSIFTERDCFEMFELLMIWSISQSAPFSHCKAMIDKMVQVVLILSDMPLCPWSLLPLPLFCHFHASLLLFFLSSVDPDRFLDVHPSSDFFTFVLPSVYICFQYMLFISESQDSLAQFMLNLQKH